MTTGADDGRRTRRTRKALAGAAAALALGGVTLALAAGGPAAGHGWQAKAVLRNAAGDRVGIVRFVGDDAGTTVKVNVTGLAAEDNSFHGLHLHANPNQLTCAAAAPTFVDVGGHWNPDSAVHGQHRGDLPSVLVVGGAGTARSYSARLPASQIAGKAVILHGGPDNFANVPARYSTTAGPGPDDATKATGDSGPRVACGVVELD